MTGILTLCANYDEKNWVEQGGSLYNKITQHIKPIVLQSVNNSQYTLQKVRNPLDNSNTHSNTLLHRNVKHRNYINPNSKRDIIINSLKVLLAIKIPILTTIIKNIQINDNSYDNIYDNIIIKLNTYLYDNGIQIPERVESSNQSMYESKYRYIIQLATLLKHTKPIEVVSGIINTPTSVLKSIPNSSQMNIRTQQSEVPISTRSNIIPLYIKEYNAAKQKYDVYLNKLQVLSNQNINVLSQFVNNIKYLKLIENPTDIEMKEEITKIRDFLNNNSYDNIIGNLNKLILKTSKINPPKLNNFNDQSKFKYIITLATFYQNTIDQTS